MKNEINISYHKTKIGDLVIGSFEGKLCLLGFNYRRKRNPVDKRIKKYAGADFAENEDEVIAEAKKQIDEYLAGERRVFDIPLVLFGTDFQKQVWKELMKIPYGQTASYSDIADRINNPKAVRAAASANGANAIAVIIPCHRVIESNGGLGGYGGGLQIKKKLLKIENVQLPGKEGGKYVF